MELEDSHFLGLPDLDAQNKQDWNSLKAKMRDCLVTSVRDANSNNGKGYIPRIVPVKSIYEAYKAIVNEEDVGRQLLIEKAFLFYKGKVRDYRLEMLPSTSGDNDGEIIHEGASSFFEFYDGLFRSIANRMKFVRIDCAPGEDAFQVFESLNGTGLSLTASDRIKNMLMGKGAREDPPISISKLSGEWQRLEGLVGKPKDVEQFFNSYMFTYVGHRVPKKDLCDVFVKNYLPDFPSIASAMNDLTRAAGYYGTIVYQKPYIDGNGHVQKLSRKSSDLVVSIRKNNPSQSVVPLLAASMEYGFDSNFEIVADRLLVLLVRHKVCQKSTNLLDKYFERFCSEIKKQPASEVVIMLKSLQQPTDDFIRNFQSMTFDEDNAAESERARYYLVSIENYLRNHSGNDSLSESEEHTLEHIIPQTIDPQIWFARQKEDLKCFEDDAAGTYFEEFVSSTIQSIGNMCLLRREENSSAGNSDFSSKLRVYQEPGEDGKTAYETFKLVRQIVDNQMNTDDGCTRIVFDGSTFDSRAVERRAKALAEYAAKIWQ